MIIDKFKISKKTAIVTGAMGGNGFAIANACAAAGASVCLISGPVNLEAPEDVRLILVDTAEQMKRACEKELEVDCVVCAAAVSDWRPLQVEKRKIKKSK